MKTDENWLALEITVDSESAEAIEFGLNELDSLGTEINNLGKAKAATICVVGYFHEKPDDPILREKLIEALRIYDFSSDAIKKIEWREVENTDWLAEWKKHWRPTKVGKFIIAPTWSEIESEKDGSQNGETIIRINPEMAFGTGTHETTRLCLQAIEEDYAGEMSFLDVGTGTGILAIAAAKLKSRVESRESREKVSSTLDSRLSTLDPISACDTDENSIEIARKNAGLNRVAENISFYVGSINENTPEFDFVCANLTADVILPILPLLLEKAKCELILSGILREQQTAVEDELKRLSAPDWNIQTLGEWMSIKIKKSK